MSSAKVIRVRSSDIGFRNLLNLVVPPLTMAEHKGQMGRVGVIGGSGDYTGAPYYAAAACLRFGADLAYVFSAKQAVIPLKCYSPEMIVTAFYDDELALKTCPSDSSQALAQAQGEHGKEQGQGQGRVGGEAVAFQSFMDGATRMSSAVAASLPRMHSLVIGPGLGRKEQVFQAVLIVLQQARERQPQLPVVLDADALWMLSQGRNLLAVHGLSRCVLTPNLMEFGQLVGAALRLVRDGSLPCAGPAAEEGQGKGKAQSQSQEEGEAEETKALVEALSSKFSDVCLRALAGLLRVTVLLKGPADLICCGSHTSKSAAPAEEKEQEQSHSASSSSSAAAAAILALDVYEVSEAGSPRRCGGQGDVLSGALGVAAHWAHSRQSHFQSLSVDIDSGDGDNGDDDDGGHISDKFAPKAEIAGEGRQGQGQGQGQQRQTSKAGKASVRPPPPVLAAILASMVTRRAAQYAFQDKRRAMSATDVLNSLGTAFESIVDDDSSPSPYRSGRDEDEY